MSQSPVQSSHTQSSSHTASPSSQATFVVQTLQGGEDLLARGHRNAMTDKLGHVFPLPLHMREEPAGASQCGDDRGEWGFC